MYRDVSCIMSSFDSIISTQEPTSAYPNLPVSLLHSCISVSMVMVGLLAMRPPSMNLLCGVKKVGAALLERAASHAFCKWGGGQSSSDLKPKFLKRCSLQGRQSAMVAGTITRGNWRHDITLSSVKLSFMYFSRISVL